MFFSFLSPGSFWYLNRFEVPQHFTSVVLFNAFLAAIFSNVSYVKPLGCLKWSFDIGFYLLCFSLTLCFFFQSSGFIKPKFYFINLTFYISLCGYCFLGWYIPGPGYYTERYSASLYIWLWRSALFPLLTFIFLISASISCFVFLKYFPTPGICLFGFLAVYSILCKYVFLTILRSGGFYFSFNIDFTYSLWVFYGK